jgi:hypothetical protein
LVPILLPDLPTSLGHKYTDAPWDDMHSPTARFDLLSSGDNVYGYMSTGIGVVRYRDETIPLIDVHLLPLSRYPGEGRYRRERRAWLTEHSRPYSLDGDYLKREKGPCVKLGEI